MNTYSVNELNSILIYNEEFDKLNTIISYLKDKIDNTNKLKEKEELLFFLIVAKIKVNDIETPNLTNTILEYINLIKQGELTQKTKRKIYKLQKNNHNPLIVYYKTIIYHTNFINELYKLKYYGSLNMELKSIKNDFIKNLNFTEKKYNKYALSFLYKHITGYGEGYHNLLFTTAIILFLFAGLFNIYDILNPGTLTSGFPGMEGVLTASFEYYVYLSTNILSNLGADGNLAITPYLRFLFEAEQLIGVILMGLFIFILGKKL